MRSIYTISLEPVQFPQWYIITNRRTGEKLKAKGQTPGVLLAQAEKMFNELHQDKS